MPRRNAAAPVADASPMPTGGDGGGALFTPAQASALRAAYAWWQEGERALDHLAELGRHEALLARLAPAFDALRAAGPRAADAASVAPILRGARLLLPNPALSRPLETDAFAAALYELLYGDAPLPARLSVFLTRQRVGHRTASQLLYASAPDRYPLVAPQTRAALTATPAQRAAARARAVARHGTEEAGDVPAEVWSLLADFELYEAARDAVRARSFTDVHCALSHAREVPPAPRRSSDRTAAARNAFATATVRESSAGYDAGDRDPAPEATEADLMRLLEAHVASRGFTFPPLAVRNYYVALKAKPFAILSGLSGTGKTRLTHLLAEAITGGVPDQYLLLPVRPDWTDGTPLLGYQNVVADRYVSTPFLDLLSRAARGESRDRAFFVCLDEMNLARVEHYLADLLSAMEAPPPRRIPLHEGRAALLPDNVFLSGSVNIDEATHPFSRKVLDRANTIEFADVALGGGDGGAGERPVAAPDIPPAERQRLFLAGRVLGVAEARARLDAHGAGLADAAVSALSDLNDLLSERGAHFGYRVRDEALRYLAASFTPEGVGLFDPADRAANARAALDLQIVQKVLSRLSGTEESLSALLARAEAWTAARGYARAAAKIARMRRRAAEDGIVTFYEL